MSILTKKISIARVFFAIIIFRFRINSSVYVVIIRSRKVNKAERMKLKTKPVKYPNV